MYYPKNDFIINFPAPFASDMSDFSQKDEITRGREGHYVMVQCSRAVVLNHIPGGPPTLHILHVSFVWHTHFMSVSLY